MNNFNGETIEEYFQYMIDNGYISKNGTPLKCQFCECIEFEKGKTYYEEVYLSEYELLCKNCGKKVDYWAYGAWEIL